MLYNRRMLMQLLVNALAFYITAFLLPGFRIDGWTTLLVIAVVWGILSVILRPILLILTLPITVLTLGLFTFVINAVMLRITSALVPGFEIDSFGTALLASIVLALVNSFLSSLKE